MSRETIGLTGAMQQWVVDHGTDETDVAVQLRTAMADHPEGGMQTSPEQAQLLRTLVHVTGAQRILEVGVFTGYSAMLMASALPPTGTLIACDISEHWLATARTWWARAGVSDRIESRCGPAIDTLQALIDDGHAGTFDMLYIDADKTSSDAYCEVGLTLVRPGGVIAIDNMFRGGRVVDAHADDESTVATRALAAKWSADPRVCWSLLPIGDGLGVMTPLA
ncbi:MAG: class I SAM-dependent methyltransferase [Phycisphaerales bacterium]|nr:class I SAM-dependent methyltransferase [Phycisphaerales bacterium]